MSLVLQTLIDPCYENGRYGTVDYRHPSNRRSTPPIWLGLKSGRPATSTTLTAGSEKNARNQTYVLCRSRKALNLG